MLEIKQPAAEGCKQLILSTTYQGQARGYGRINRQNLVFQLPFWGQHFKP